MARLDGTRILLGVGGGIAAYKTPELVRRLQDAGADVRVVLTDAGARFVSPLSVEVVSGHPVGQKLWATDGDSRIVHTDLGKEVDLIVLAPATANLIARVRHGFADDLLTTAVMACATPVLVCPSMNTDMLGNAFVQDNLRALEAQDRYTLLEPSRGLLACGVTGPGRLPDPPVIRDAAAAALTPKRLSGVRAMVSAGPTREPIDPVRFMTNHSTGTMGFAVAEALAAHGADVTLVAGPVPLATPVGVQRRVDVVTAAELADAVQAGWAETDLLVMTAAVADYRPAKVFDRKLKKGDRPEELALERTLDVLGWTATAAGRDEKVVVGFAAETHDLEVYAAEKLARKRLDWIVANDVSMSGIGFGAGDNAGMLLGRDGERVTLHRADKASFARTLVDRLADDLRPSTERAP